MSIQINEDIAIKVLSVVDAGLVHGMGEPVLGHMCVEAAVCYALGLPHGDDPQCVDPFLRLLKIALNDSRWSSNEARTRGMRRLAVAQLGSKDVLDTSEFKRRHQRLAIQKAVPFALRAAAVVNPRDAMKLEEVAKVCEDNPTIGNAQVAYAATYAAYAAAAAAADAAAYAAAYAAYAAYAAAQAAIDKFLTDYCESVVGILIEMKAPGCQWLYLTETKD